MLRAEDFSTRHFCRITTSNSLFASSAGGADFLHPTAIAVGLRTNNICVTARAPRLVTHTAIAKARDLCCRVSRRRALPWLAANWWGSSFRQLSQAVVDISRVPRLTAIGLSEVVILQKIVRHDSQCHAATFRGGKSYKTEVLQLRLFLIANY